MFTSIYFMCFLVEIIIDHIYKHFYRTSDYKNSFLFKN